MAKKSGLKVDRKYTTPGNPYNNITWEKRSSKITNPDGSVVFEMNDVEIPSTWSQVATDIMVSKYFRKAGVPQTDADGVELHGDIGEKKPDTSLLLTTHKHLKMNLNLCSLHKWQLQIVLSGLTLV